MISMLFFTNMVEETCIPLIWSVSDRSPVHVLQPFYFWTDELSDNFRLKDRVIFDGSIFNAYPHELQVT